MLTSLLLSTALAAPVSASAVDSAGSADATPLYGLFGEVLGTSGNFENAVGGNHSNPFLPIGLRLVQRDVYEVHLHNTGTGWDEMMLVAVPSPTPEPKPLLVAFHGYSSSPYSVLYQTDYLEKARARGWWAIAPLGAHQYNYGVDYAQDNIEAAIRWVMNHANIDPDRIYGLGFSMGGGVAATFAARHQDPNGPRMAAIVNHTGTVSMRDVYNNAAGHSLLEDPQMFQGSPDEYPFLYAKASAIDYNLYTDTIDQSNDLARNLKHIPVKQWAVAGDPLDHLVNQTGLLHDQILTRGGNSMLEIGTGSVHTWNSITEREVLNYLQGKVRQDPAPGVKTRVLVHEDGRYWHFDIDQRTEGQFSSFEWKILTGLNRVYLEKVSNIEHIFFNPERAGLQTGQDVEIVVQALQADSVLIEVAGYTAPPTIVMRDSVATSAWTWDAQHECVQLIEDDPSSYRLWTVEP